MAESWLPQSEPIVINNDDDALNAAAYFSVKSENKNSKRY